VGIAAISIPIVIRWGLPDLMIYGGLSGLDCALYALLMVLFMKRELHSRSWIWVAFFSLLLGGLVAKIIYETATGLTIFVGNNQTNMVHNKLHFHDLLPGSACKFQHQLFRS